MVGTKKSALLTDVQEAIDIFYDDMFWVAFGSLEYNKGCVIRHSKTGVVVAVFKKNYDALDVLTNPDKDLRKKMKIGLGIDPYHGLAYDLNSSIRKLVTEAKIFMQRSGGIRPQFIYRKGIPIDVKLAGIDKEI